MDGQQVMFVETQGQILNRFKASLMGTHAGWQILFITDASLTTRAVYVAQSMLQCHNLQQGTELTDKEGQADTPSMFDGPVQWKPLMEKPVEQGLIQTPRDPLETQIG